MVDGERRIEFAFPTPAKLFTPFVTCALVLIIIGYALAHHAPVFTGTQLCISSSAVFGLKFWQFVTYPFINGCPWPMVFNSLVVLFIGSAIEKEWRTKLIVILWLVVSVTCGLLWFFAGFIFRMPPGAGAGACAYGLIAAFGLLFRRKRFIIWFWPMEAQHIAILFIVVGIVIGIAQPISWIWVMGAPVSYLYVKFLWQRAVNSPIKILRTKNTRGGGFVDLD